MPRTLAEIRARAQAHEEQIDSRRWLTPAQLAERWGFRSVSTIYAIPIEQLQYKGFGTGPKPRRRYREDWVEAFENSDAYRTAAVRDKNDTTDQTGEAAR